MIIPLPNTSQLGFVGIFRMSMENFSRMSVGMYSLALLILKETQHLRKGQMIMSTLLVMMAANATNVVAIIFYLTSLDSNRLITEAMVDMEEMLRVVMAVVK